MANETRRPGSAGFQPASLTRTTSFLEKPPGWRRSEGGAPRLVVLVKCRAPVQIVGLHCVAKSTIKCDTTSAKELSYCAVMHFPNVWAVAAGKDHG
jgi:hypothetical protein